MSLVSLISSGDNSIIVIIVAGGSILEGEKGGGKYFDITWSF